MSRVNLRTNRIQNSFRTLQKRLSAVLKRVNAEAAAQMKSGQYDTANGVMQISRSFREFNERMASVAQDWEELSAQATAKMGDLGIVTGALQGRTTSAKALCLPALHAVLRRGGRAQMSDIISDLDHSTPSMWKDGDIVETDGRPKWQSTLDKAYRRSQRYGWIEKRADGTWLLTEKGLSAVNTGT